MPWNQKTPLGYLGELCVSIAAAGSYFIVSGTLLTLFISMCLHHNAFYEMFVHSVRALDHMNSVRNEKMHLCELIRFHTSIKA